MRIGKEARRVVGAAQKRKENGGRGQVESAQVESIQPESGRDPSLDKWESHKCMQGADEPGNPMVHPTIGQPLSPFEQGRDGTEYVVAYACACMRVVCVVCLFVQRSVCIVIALEAMARRVGWQGCGVAAVLLCGCVA